VLCNTQEISDEITDKHHTANSNNLLRASFRKKTESGLVKPSLKMNARQGMSLKFITCVQSPKEKETPPKPKSV
jgi:hypothetical protein